MLQPDRTRDGAVARSEMQGGTTASRGHPGSRWRCVLEPERLIEHFMAHPPLGFTPTRLSAGTPAFHAWFDPLTTADPRLRRRLMRLPAYPHWSRWLRLKTLFVGTTVSEYAPLGRGVAAHDFARELSAEAGKRRSPPAPTLVVVKDLPQSSPLIPAEDQEHVDRACSALVDAGFVMVAGQALAWVPIDFENVDEYIARFSRARRRDVRRKLRARDSLDIELRRTGPAFADPDLRRDMYRLYLAVYEQSDLQFDLLSADFFNAVLQDAMVGGHVFLYRNAQRLIGFNLCVRARDTLVDKYVGFAYPEARDHNLYCISWMQNLEHARSMGLTHFVAGWTDPEIKAQLGARFTMTRHAVLATSPALRAVLRRFVRWFERDREWFDQHSRDAGHP